MTEHVTAYFLAWSEGTLDRPEEVERHLAACHACRAYYDEMTAMLDPSLLGALPSPLPDPSLPARIGMLAAAPRKPIRGAVPALKLSLEGLALAAAVVAGVLIGRAISSPPADHTPSDVVAAYESAMVPDDFPSTMETIVAPSKGDTK